jgi:hypothetical protein
MHELSIAMSIVHLATEEAAARGHARVLAVHLRLGSPSDGRTGGGSGRSGFSHEDYRESARQPREPRW